MNIKKLML